MARTFQITLENSGRFTFTPRRNPAARILPVQLIHKHTSFKFTHKRG